MDLLRLEATARRLLSGELTIEDFLRQCDSAVAAPSSGERPRIADLGDAQLDLDRARRCGFPEVVFAEGKSADSLRRIVAALLADEAPVLVTRVAPEQAERLAESFPAGRHNALARTFAIPRFDRSTSGAGMKQVARRGRVVVVSAGTSDRPVAEEARETALWMGADVHLIQDVGVAGPQRLEARLDEIRQADAIVVVAGMEGALPSVVGGQVRCPVIAVPTSVGYGASFGGVAALLSMLNSCAANVVVVNIDAGFKAGYVAGMIALRTANGVPAGQQFSPVSSSNASAGAGSERGTA